MKREKQEKPPAPTCRFCNRPLRVYRFRRAALMHAAEKSDRIAAQKSGQVRQYWLNQAAADRELASRIPQGSEFGGEGDNLFCNRQCGHRWAVNQLRKMGGATPFVYKVPA